MTTLPEHRIIGVLRFAPAEGLTTREVADKIGTAKLLTVSTRLSRLANWGRIDRTITPIDRAPHRLTRYRLKDVEPSNGG